MTLTDEQAEQLTELLNRSRRYLSDAASPYRMYQPNYASLATEIGEMMEMLGIEPE